MDDTLVNWPANTHRGTVPDGTVLLTLSGGIDSTYALWRLLTEGHKVVVLHVDLVNWEGRSSYESRAVDRILDWLTSQGLDQWEFVRTVHDYGSLTFVVRDIEVVRFHAGITLRQRRYRGIDTVVASGIAEDPDLPDADVDRIRRILEDAARRQVGLWRPIRHVPKAQVIASMPPELLALTWWCRRPRQGGVTCGECRTCRHVAAADANPWTGPAPVLEPPPGTATEPVVVPRGNASRQTWEAYARTLGVGVPSDASRDQIRDLVRDEGCAQ